MLFILTHTQADGKRACPRQGNSPSSLCPLASVQAPREQLGSLTPAVPNSFKFTSLSAFKGGFDKCIALCSQPGSNCQEDYDKLFSCCFKTIWRTACPPGAGTPQPCCSRAEGRQQGAKFTLIIALDWGLFGQSPAQVLRADTHCRPVGDLCWRGALCQGSSSVSPGTSGASGVPAAELPRGPLKWKLKRSVSPWE